MSNKCYVKKCFFCLGSTTDSSSPEYSENIPDSQRQQINVRCQSKEIELKDFKPHNNGSVTYTNMSNLFNISSRFVVRFQIGLEPAL